MAARIGGETPIIKYGLELTAEPPATVSEALPIEAGALLRLGGAAAADGSHYKVQDAATSALMASGRQGQDQGAEAAGVILCMALHRITDPKGVLGVKVLGPFQQVRRLKYTTGAAPALGQSISVSATVAREVRGVAFDGSSYVLFVDTVALEVEVLC